MELELVTKQPKDKPPFIGILFARQYDAHGLNQEWIEEYSLLNYEIKIIPVDDKVNVTIIQEQNNLSHTYFNVKCDFEKLMKFLYLYKACKKFNFAHIHSVYGNHEVIKTLRILKYFVLKINSIKFISPDVEF